MRVEHSAVESGRRRCNGAPIDTGEAGCHRDIGSQPRSMISRTCCRHLGASHKSPARVMRWGPLDTIDDSLPGYSPESGESVGVERLATGGVEEEDGGSHGDQGDEVSYRIYDVLDAIEDIMALQSAIPRRWMSRRTPALTS